MAMGAIGDMQTMMDMMDQCMSGAKSASVTMPMEDMQKMMGHAQAAHEAMTGAKHTPAKAVVPEQKMSGVVYLK